jgi:poly-gamma-glutamate capsule biosynthesis protein CapA/YwtB (metallophosphatase superfamily)
VSVQRDIMEVPVCYPDTSHDSARQAFVGIGLRWLRIAGTTLYLALALALASVIGAPVIATQTDPWPSTREHDMSSGSDEVTRSAPAHSVAIFLGGDVMTGRGIDQILPRPSHPRIYESFVQDARDYVGLAERANGPIPRRAAFSYVWGDAIEELDRVGPAARIVNVETSITRSDDYWVGKGINYRMHPSNVSTLTSARIDVAVLANNHVLDYGPAGLQETLDTLRRAVVRTAGAGRDLAEAESPAIVHLPEQARLILFAFGLESSGIPTSWAARRERPGIALLGDLSQGTATTIIERVKRNKQQKDIVVASFHWGGNWGYEVPAEHVRFAHWLIDGGVDIIHGHSSHHPRPVEVYRNRLILYGCGDLLNDYEGIAGYEEFRNDLALMYFVSVSPTGELLGLRMMPMQIRKFRLNRVSATDAQWLRDTLDRVSRPFGSRIRLQPDASLALEWP